MADAIWRCARPATLSLRHWADGTVLYDDVSTELRCLSPAAGTLLAALIQRPCASTHLLATDLLQGEPTAADLEMVENVLAEFSNLNLVEQLVV